MKTQSQLVSYYERRLKTVKAMWSDKGDRGKDYIKDAKKQLQAVKKGRNW